MTPQAAHNLSLCLLLVITVIAIAARWYISSLWTTPWAKLSRRDKWAIGTGTFLMAGENMIFGIHPFLDLVLLFVGGGLLFWAFSFLPDSSKDQDSEQNGVNEPQAAINTQEPGPETDEDSTDIETVRHRFETRSGSTP